VTVPLNTIRLEPVKKAAASVIWLHGLGADGYDFMPVIKQMDLPEIHSVRFVLPNAPMQPVTLNNGMTMPSWYDIYGIGKQFDEDDSGIRKSEAAVRQLIQAELDLGVAHNRIFLVGFSQGGALALHTGLRLEQPLAGLIALSTYLPLRDRIEVELNHVQKRTPICIMHGRQDEVVPIEFAELSFEILKHQGLDCRWHEYTMEHNLCADQIIDIKEFIVNQLKDINGMC